MNRINAITVLSVVASFHSVPACQAEERDIARLDTITGQDLIISKGCGSCHSLEAIPAAKGKVGPPLDNIDQRIYIGGVLPNSQENLAKFLMKPEHFHPETAMPQPELTWQEAQYLSRYLWNL